MGKSRQVATVPQQASADLQAESRWPQRQPSPSMRCAPMSNHSARRRALAPSIYSATSSQRFLWCRLLLGDGAQVLWPPLGVGVPAANQVPAADAAHVMVMSLWVPTPASTGTAVGEPVPGPATASWATSAATRRAMQANRRRDTRPELAIRHLLHARGLRYRVDARPLPASRFTADIIFIRARIAVFIDGLLVAWLRRPLPAPRPQRRLLGQKDHLQPSTRPSRERGPRHSWVDHHQNLGTRTTRTRRRPHRGRRPQPPPTRHGRAGTDTSCHAA